MKQPNQKVRSVLSVLTKMLVIACVVGLAGCENSDVARVKAMKLDIDPSFTIGQAFDNRKVCDSVKWDNMTDQRGRKLVEYRCDFKGVKEFAAPMPSPIVKMDELFQWSVEGDGTLTLAYVGIESIHQDGKVDDQAFAPEVIMHVIAQDTAEDLKQYNAQVIHFQNQ